MTKKSNKKNDTNNDIKTKTGIKGFDKLVDGGFPIGSNILLSGSPATGKTIFGLEYLYNGAAKYNENGLYISYEESKENLLKTCKQFGWKIDKLVDEKKINIISFQKEELFLETLMADIKRQIEGYNIKRIVIDSLTTLNYLRVCEYKQDIKSMPQEYELKKFLYKLIMWLSKFTQTTKILITEVEGDSEKRLASDDVSPFLCDGIVFIKYRTMGGFNSRDLIVRKMRHINNNSEFKPFQITNKGIVIKDME